MIKSNQHITKSGTIEEGLRHGLQLTQNWNSQPNHPKVFIFGKRIHHGTIGIVLTALGIHYKIPYLMGYGTSLVLDDINDFEDWFKFEDKSTYETGEYIDIL